MATATKDPVMKDAQNASVRVEIFDQAYNLRGSDPEYILKLAEYVDAKMRADPGQAERQNERLAPRLDEPDERGDQHRRRHRQCGAIDEARRVSPASGGRAGDSEREQRRIASQKQRDPAHSSASSDREPRPGPTQPH